MLSACYQVASRCNRNTCEGLGAYTNSWKQCKCLRLTGHDGVHECSHHTWESTKEKVPMVKRNCWGVPMADEVIERQECCKEEEGELAYKDQGVCVEGAEGTGRVETKQCPNKEPHEVHDWCVMERGKEGGLTVHCRGVEEKVPEKGTRESPLFVAGSVATLRWCCCQCCQSNVTERGIRRCSACNAIHQVV